jgi:MscS family membrane protein
LQWLITLSLIVLSFLIARAIYWLFKGWLRLLVKRTRLSIDDLLLNMAEEPAVFMLLAAGIRLSLRTLNLPESVSNFINHAYVFLLLIGVTWLITRLYDAAHQQWMAPLAAHTGTSLDDQLLPVLRTGVRFILWTLGIIIGLNNAGYNVGTILAGLGIGGLAFALAAQDTIANIFGGVTILLQGPFQIRDVIILDGRWLVVKQIGLRASILVDFDTDHEVIIPNNKFTTSIITNVSRLPSHIKYLTLHLSPATSAADTARALAQLRAAADDHPEAEAVFARLDHFEPGAIVVVYAYRILAFGNRHRVTTEVNLEIMRRFEQHGLKLALPIAQRLPHSDSANIFG